MSTEQSLDPQLIEETKQQIRGLVNEIARLSKSELAPEEFHQEFLPRIVSALAAVGGAIWTTEEHGRLALAYQMNLQQTKLRENEEDQIRHGRLLHKVLSTGEGILVPPHSGAGEDDQVANPTDFLLVLGPLKTDLEVVGVVEVFQRPEAPATTQKGYLRFLLQMCDLASEYFKSRKLRHYSDRQVLWTQLEEFTRVVHASLEPRETAYTIANEGRRLIECDRVSVAIRRGRKCRIEAVSGQDLFDKRSNTVRLLGQLATAVVAGGEPVWYTGDTADMAPQVEDAVQEYVDESHSKTVAVLPLTRPRPADEDEEVDADKREPPEPPIGALIVEQIEDSRVPAKMLQRVDVVSHHSSIALANALEHNNLFLMPLWRALGKARWVLKARTLPKTVAVVGAIVAVLLCLVLFPYGFKLQGKGTLEPVDRCDVFAGIDGVVTDVTVKHGDRVDKKQLLARLRNTDLEVAVTDVVGQRTITQEQISSLERQVLAERMRSDDERKQVASQVLAQVLELKKKLFSLDGQLLLLRKKQEDLEVLSPGDGQVVTWDVRNLLIHRPVQRGQVLMRVADPKGPWQLELNMPENRMGHIVRAQNQIKQQDKSRDLRVEFILATDPATTFEGTVKEIHLSAEVRGEEGNTVLIKVAVDKEKLPQPLRPGAQVTAKIDCGTRPIGYVWFHDAIAWFRSRILFRF